MVVRIVPACPSLAAAADRLGMSKHWVRVHATRLGVRSGHRFGRERLPSEAEFIEQAALAASVEGLARRYGIGDQLVRSECDRLGIPAPIRGRNR